MSTRNPFAQIAEAALSVAIDQGEPISAHALHRIINSDIDLKTAQMRLFNVEQGVKALTQRAIESTLRDYGPAVGMGRDAEHVPELTAQTAAQRMAMMEQQKAYLDEKLAELRNQYAQMTLEGDLAAAVGSESVSA